jgi:TolB-like protein
MEHSLNPECNMGASGPKPAGSLAPEDIRRELQCILSSRMFRAAQGQRKFLAYVVEKTLAGSAHLLKEYVIATEALRRDASFDPRLDPIVRTEARKLRARLAKYYQTEGAGDPLRIELPKGSYIAVFHAVTRDSESEPAAEVSSETPPLAPGLEAHSTAHTDAERQLSRGRVILTYSLGVLLAVSSVAVAYRILRGRWTETTFANSDASIAVLPLTNLGDNSEEFLSDGLTDELIDSLRQVPGLQVVARTSAFRFKAKTVDIRQIDQELRVRAVLVGSVSRSENRIRVVVQLNSAENGYHLWSGSYERDSANIETILPEIASAVSNALGVGLVPARRQNPIQTPPSPNREAHEDYLKGLYFRNQFNPDGLNRAIEFFKRAIAEDPSFAWAYAGLADCYAMGRPVAAARPLEMVPKIRATASKALELDATLGEPHFDLAVSAEYEFDWATAEEEFKKGLELSPGDVVGHLWYAQYLSLVGKKPDMLAQLTIAARLDPVSPWAVQSVGVYYSGVGRYGAAVEQFQSALALEPRFGLAHEGLGLNYLLENTCGNGLEELRLANKYMPGPRRLGHLGYGYAVCGHAPEARRILTAFLNGPRQDVPAFVIAEIYLGLGDTNQAFPWFEKAVDERDLSVSLKWDPRFDSLRSDPRFDALLRRMKLS